MPRGHPDFWGAMITAMPVYGSGQVNFYLAEDGDIAGVSFADLAEYTVPALYELHFMGGALGSDHPAITKYSVAIMGVPAALGYFDLASVMPFHPSSAIIVPALYTVALRVYNEDAVAHHYAALAIGFLVEKGA